jgi:uncharacterized protein YdaT
MLYSKDSYPSVMEPLSEEVRRKAIQFSNEMLLDGNVRYHKDFVILQAIEKARLSVNQKQKDGSQPKS